MYATCALRLADTQNGLIRNNLKYEWGFDCEKTTLWMQIQWIWMTEFVGITLLRVTFEYQNSLNS